MATSIQIARSSMPGTHRWRVYNVLIDGLVAGALTRAAWLGEYEVAAGRRLVQITSGRLASQVVAVVAESGTTTLLDCGARPPLEALSRRITDPQRSIVLRAEAWAATAVARRMPFTWRITRYDPARRSATGAYAGDAWTSVSDIGGTFEDGTLTFRQYLMVEDAYLDAVEAFAASAGVTHLQIRDPEFHGRERRRPGRFFTPGRVLPVREALVIARAALREEMWCRLEALTDDFTVHVGDDFYLYVGSTRDCHDAVETVAAGELFVEDFSEFGSPYAPDDAPGEPISG